MAVAPRVDWLSMTGLPSQHAPLLDYSGACVAADFFSRFDDDDNVNDKSLHGAMN
ncbi:hypothetical protein P0D69_38065 [Paraburkholderia sediminicola]|uniref:hypothetical protein n=1 Tax=Paraburkholderia sediminicola TaxID=458836 RepID=UPI0038B832FC